MYIHMCVTNTPLSSPSPFRAEDSHVTWVCALNSTTPHTHFFISHLHHSTPMPPPHSTPPLYTTTPNQLHMVTYCFVVILVIDCLWREWEALKTLAVFHVHLNSDACILHKYTQHTHTHTHTHTAHCIHTHVGTRNVHTVVCAILECLSLPVQWS